MSQQPPSREQTQMNRERTADEQHTPVDANKKQDEAGRRLLTDGGQDDAKVVGHNTDSDGETVGVWGAVESENGYGLATDDDAKITGRIDTSLTDFLVETGTTDSGDPQNVIMGHASNGVDEGVVGATISGGGLENENRNQPNKITGDYGTIGGGEGNTASQIATVAGGHNNTASSVGVAVGGGASNEGSGWISTVAGGEGNTANDRNATVGGGKENTASGEGATVPGGQDNLADGDYSFAAGREAEANHEGTFVWSDSNNGVTTSTAANQFLIDAAGGVGIGTDDPAQELHVRPSTGSIGLVLQNSGSGTGTDDGGWGMGTGADSDNLNFYWNDTLSGSWSVTARITTDGEYVQMSDARRKEGVESLDSVLADVCSLRPTRYRFRDSESASFGFIAQEVRELFPEMVTESNDERGLLALAYDQFAPLAIGAIQEQQELIENQARDLGEKDDRIADLEETVDRLETAETEREQQDDRIDELEARNDELEARNDELEKRLAALEATVGTAKRRPADD